MKILKMDKKTKEIVAIPESTDDLWHLEKVIDKGDIVSGSTDRKIKPKHEGEKAQRIIVHVDLEVEEAHFQEYSSNLKINGKILQAKPAEFAEIGSHQSIDVGVGEKIRLRKNELKMWQIERLKKAEAESASSKLLVALMDDEGAELAFVSQFSLNKKATIKAGKRGKMFAEEKSDYFQDVLEKIVQLAPKKVLIVGPGFVKDNFKKFFDDKKPKGFAPSLTESTSSVGETGFNELIKSGKLEAVEKQLQLSKETKLIEEFLALLAKGKADYGKKQVENAINLGAADKVLLSETYLMQNRKEAEKVLDLAERMGCETNIISSKNPQEKSVTGMGGAICTLRYKLEK